jgi:hypothetical protein
MNLLHPTRVWARTEVLDPARPVPKEPGVYAWYFKAPPDGVPTVACHQWQGLTLLYVGIAPRQQLSATGQPSRQRLAHRVRYHYRGNAEGSTLRLTLGCLLANRLGIELRRVGSGRRMTFGPGESLLSEWMAENAMVTWQVSHQPWALEAELIQSVALPLNLDMNRAHPFHATLSGLRRIAKQRARELPVIA